ncbi:MAG: thioredoxin family protein [Lautropia sp.]|nr:thioredoxin family protein [Lautropia sp.]
MSAQTAAYLPETLTRAELDTKPGVWLLEFGIDSCPHCQAAQPHIRQALTDQQALTHLKIEDGRGRPLGRSFGVKLWPTLILLKDGQEIARIIRPQSSDALAKAFALLD